ncbi:MAG: cytochrome c3 family protein [Woeseiaceae bacterium]
MDAVPDSCGACHTVDDSHAGQLGKDCLQCHSQQAWRQMIRFDHDLTTFPLTGLHATVACAACHASNRFHDAEKDCASCHGDNDVHEGALGNECGSCHNSNDWAMTSFDHNQHTNFVLDGGHEHLACVDCHRDPTASATDVPSSCGGCHVTDDVHQGQFGLQCEQCHSTTSFEDVESLGGRRQ